MLKLECILTFWNKINKSEFEESNTYTLAYEEFYPNSLFQFFQIHNDESGPNLATLSFALAGPYSLVKEDKPTFDLICFKRQGNSWAICHGNEFES